MFEKFKEWLLRDQIADIKREIKREYGNILSDELNERTNITQQNYGGSGYGSWEDFIDEKMEKHACDLTLYNDYDDMDMEMPEISACLDTNSEYCVYPANTKKTDIFEIKIKNKNKQDRAEKILKRLKLHTNLFGMIRNVFKYGDNFEEIITNKQGNQVNELKHIQIRTIVPNVKDGELPQKNSYKQVDQAGQPVVMFDKNEIFHLSLNFDRERWLKYRKGTSILAYSRLSYRQIALIEKALMIGRLSRANKSFGIMLDVGSYEGDDALAYIEKFRKKQTRRKYIDSYTGKWKWEYNPLTIVEDIIIPTRQGSGANIQPLNDNISVGKDIKDVEYWQDKLIYSTHTPKILIGKESDINSKNTSETQMSCFLRKIRRFQMILEPQLKEFIAWCLAIEGVHISTDEIDLVWPIANYIDEQRKWTIEKLKLELGSLLIEMGLVDDFYIYTELMGMTEEEANALIERLDAIEENYADEVDAMIANAEDKSDMTDQEYEDEVTSGKDDDDVDDEQTTEEEMHDYLKQKLGEEKYNKLMENRKILDENPSIKDLVVRLLYLTQAKVQE